MLTSDRMTDVCRLKWSATLIYLRDKYNDLMVCCIFYCKISFRSKYLLFGHCLICALKPTPSCIRMCSHLVTARPSEIDTLLYGPNNANSGIVTCVSFGPARTVYRTI